MRKAIQASGGRIVATVSSRRRFPETISELNKTFGATMAFFGYE